MAATSKLGGSNRAQKRKRAYNWRSRHNAETVAKLEEKFNQCSHPSETQRRQISKELGLDPHQVKFWFQNKRIQLRTASERLDSNVLRLENEKIRSENQVMKEAMENVLCSHCGGKATGEEKEHELPLEIVKVQNILITQECERITSLLVKNGVNPALLPSSSTSSHDTSRGRLLKQMVGIPCPNQSICNHDHHIPACDQNTTNCNQLAPCQHNTPVVNQGIPAVSQGISTVSQGIPTVSQRIPAPTPLLCQDNPTLASVLNQDIAASALDQHIPTVTTPAIDQHFLNRTTSAIDQNILALDPTLSEDEPPLISCLDYNIPALVTALDQNIPELTFTRDQSNRIRVVEQAIQRRNHGVNIISVTPTLAQNIPTLGQGISAYLNLDSDRNLEILNNDDILLQPMRSRGTNVDSELMSKIANNAMEELIKLLSMNEPFWFRSMLDGKFILQHDIYQRTFRRSNSLSGPYARVESSKDSRLVKMSAAQLVEMFLNSDKWVDLFPTIVKNARTIQVLESGSLGNRNGVLQLINAEMHILSHLVPAREVLFLRYCKQISVGVWAIGDVSLESLTHKNNISCAWRLPSGCLIQDMDEGLCRVSWVEHMEVDDKIQTHQLFREVICGNNAYGAERWVLTLERMCERFASATAETIPSSEAGGVIRSPKGRRSIMHLAHRMVKSFCKALNLKDNKNFPHLTSMNNSGIEVSVRVNNRQLDEPKGMIISAATSFWLPLSPHTVFDILADNKKRAKWDTLCCESVGHEIQRISTGTNPGNYISIMRPFIPAENNLMVLQESYVDALGSMLVYAPFHMPGLNRVMRGEGASQFPVLPSGITISWDGQSEGSLLTLMLQILASSLSKMGMVDINFVGSVNTLVTTTVEKIKVALNCSNLNCNDFSSA